MRFYTVVLAFFTFTLSALPANAAPGSHSAGIGIGEIILLGDYSDHFSNNLGFQLVHEYQASQMFSLMTIANMSSHSNADSSETLSIMGLTPNLRANLAYIDKLIFYAYSGFGLFSVSEKIRSVEGSAITLGFNMGMGFDLALDQHFTFGTSMAFHNIFGQTDSNTVSPSMPDGLDMGGTYFGVMLNVKYVF